MEGMDSWAGKLLVSTPQISDGVFERSVVLVLAHDDESGAQGVVLNKPVQAPIDTVLPGWQENASRPQMVFQGGPVQTDSAVGLVGVPGDEDPAPGIKRLFGAIGLVDLDAPQELIWPEISDLRIFAGYAGWEADQLEGEIAQGGWFVVDAEIGDVFDADPDTLWRRVLRRQSGVMAWLSTYPEDPSHN